MDIILQKNQPANNLPIKPLFFNYLISVTAIGEIP
jgi:hypothetical protein